MSKGKKKKNGGIIAAAVVLIIAAIAMHLSGLKENTAGLLSEIRESSGDLTVTFLNVGQGDCEIVELPDGRVILIDCGEKEQWKTVATYLDKENVETIDYCIATHPHADHIGGMSYIIERYNIGEFYMPNATNDTKVFNAMITALENSDADVIQATAGTVVIDEENLKAEFLAPVSEEYDDLNNYSAVLKLTYSDTSFLFSGDAEKEAEKEMIEKYSSKLESDVLKVGHHGSDTSSCKDYLTAVNPEYAVISCGEDNSYQHPNEKIVERITERGIKLYRTDEDGTVIMKSDGVSVSVE